MKKIYYVQPSPLHQSLQFNEVSEHRKQDCIHYSICLDTTAARNWNSFSCKNCQMYTSDPDSLNQDALGCRKLFKFISELEEINEFL